MLLSFVLILRLCTCLNSGHFFTLFFPIVLLKVSLKSSLSCESAFLKYYYSFKCKWYESIPERIVHILLGFFKTPGWCNFWGVRKLILRHEMCWHWKDDLQDLIYQYSKLPNNRSYEIIIQNWKSASIIVWKKIVY